MKKAFRIEMSRYPSRDLAIHTDPERLNQAYRKIRDEWIRLSKTSSRVTPEYISEDYVGGLNFARVIIPVNNPDIIAIELGTQEIKKGILEELAKQLDLPFDQKQIRYE